MLSAALFQSPAGVGAGAGRGFLTTTPMTNEEMRKEVQSQRARSMARQVLELWARTRAHERQSKDWSARTPRSALRRAKNADAVTTPFPWRRLRGLLEFLGLVVVLELLALGAGAVIRLPPY